MNDQKKKRKLIINKDALKNVVLQQVAGGTIPSTGPTSTRPCSDASCFHDYITNCLS